MKVYEFHVKTAKKPLGQIVRIKGYNVEGAERYLELVFPKTPQRVIKFRREMKGMNIKVDYTSPIKVELIVL